MNDQEIAACTPMSWTSVEIEKMLNESISRFSSIGLNSCLHFRITKNFHITKSETYWNVVLCNHMQIPLETFKIFTMRNLLEMNDKLAEYTHILKTDI